MHRPSRCLEYEGVDAAWEAREMRAFSANVAIRSATSVANFLLGRLLETDIHVSCKPMLPKDIHEMNAMTIQGVCLLQIVDIVNIGANFEHRTEDTKGPTRTLKLCLTDGHQTVYGFEFKWIPSLTVKTPRGTKVLIQNVAVRHGLLLLTPETCQVVGAPGNGTLDIGRLSSSEPRAEKPSGAYSAALMMTTVDLSANKQADDTTPARAQQSSNPPTRHVSPETSAPIPPRPASLPRTAAELMNEVSMARPVISTTRSDSRAAQSRPSPFSSPRARPAAAANPAVYVDVLSEDDDMASDITDPMVEHLFYSPNTPRVQNGANSRSRASLKRPHPESIRSRPTTPPPPILIDQSCVVDMTDSPTPIVSEIEPVPAFSLLSTAFVQQPEAPKPPANPKSPFLYLNSNTSSLSASTTRIGSILTIRGFMKSVAGFQFNTGAYMLRVLIEDGTATKEVQVDPAMVETLMGVPCVQFLQAMQKTPAVAHKLAAKMQVVLMTMQGLMQLRLDAAPDKWTLLQCREYTSEETHALLARVRYHHYVAIL